MTGFVPRTGLSAHFVAPTSKGGGRTQKPRVAEGAAAFLFPQPYANKYAAVSKIRKPRVILGAFVPRTGIEPALPCDNQILSLARLPIPPSGLVGLQY